MTIKAELLYSIAKRCKLWGGDPLKTDMRALPWLIEGNRAYMLALQDGTVNLYQARTVEISGVQYPRLDTKPLCVRVWKSLDHFNELASNYK